MYKRLRAHVRVASRSLKVSGLRKQAVPVGDLVRFMSVLWVLFSSLSLFDHRNRICTVKRIMLCFSVSWRCSCLGVGCKRLLQLLPNIFIDEQHTVSDPLILQCLISLFYMEQNKTLILKVTRYSLSAWGIAFEIFVHLFLIISRININNTNSFLCCLQDLNRLGRDLNKIVIVDNSPASYMFHPRNAVSLPI